MAHKPKYARQEPRRNTALKLLPLVLVAVVAVVLIIKTVGGKKPEESPPTTVETQPVEPVASATVGVQGDLLMH